MDMAFYSQHWYRKLVFVLVTWCLCWNDTVGRQNITAVQHIEQPTQPRVYDTTTSKNAGKRTAQPANEFALQQPVQQSGILNLGCNGIRIRRYVSNGFCTSRRPIRDMICEGQCLPMESLPWFEEFSKVSNPKKRIWRCVQDEIRRKKVKVYCNDGSEKKYRVLVVRSCKCKRYTRQQNVSNPNLRRR